MADVRLLPMDPTQTFYKNVGKVLFYLRGQNKDFHKTAEYTNILRNARDKMAIKNRLVNLLKVYPKMETLQAFKDVMTAHSGDLEKYNNEHSNILLAYSVSDIDFWEKTNQNKKSPAAEATGQ